VLSNPWSKSPDASARQSLWRNSARVTTSPGLLEQQSQDRKRLLLHPDFQPVSVQLAGVQVGFKRPEANEAN